MESSPYLRCIRCGGTTVYETFYGPHKEYGGYRCMICGDIVDPVILQNRMMRTNPQTIRSEARA
jgi:hypothetical protein